MTEKNESIRLFLGLALPEECSEHIGLSAAKLKLKGARLIPAGNLHLTLRFFGYFDLKNLEKLETRLQKTAKKFTAFQMTIQGWGAFPSTKKARVVWAGINAGNDICKEIWWETEKIARSLDYPDENRFHAHITVARFKEPGPVSPELDSAGEEVLCSSFEIDRIIVFQSKLSPSGAQYSRFREYPFTGIQGDGRSEKLDDRG